MSKARVVVLEVISGHLSVTGAARVYGLSRQHIYRLLKRYREGGLEAVDPRSRRPASNPHAVALDHPPHPGPPRADHPPAPQTAPQFLSPLRRRTTQRVLAIRLHPLDP